MRAFYVPIPEETMVKLRQVARSEWRSAKEQASVLLIEGVERRAGRAAGQEPTPEATTADPAR